MIHCHRIGVIGLMRFVALHSARLGAPPAPVPSGAFGADRLRFGLKHSAMSAERDLAADRWERLIREVATRQDRAAFAALFEHFAPRVKSLMLRSGANVARAEELAQETMLAVWSKAALFDPEKGSAVTWVFAIARNLRIDALRRDQRGERDLDGDTDIERYIDSLPGSDSLLAAAQLERRVRAALEKLSNDQSRVVELSFFEEKAHGEIAELLQIPLGTVKSRLRLAMARLRALLGDLS